MISEHVAVGSLKFVRAVNLASLAVSLDSLEAFKSVWPGDVVSLE